MDVVRQYRAHPGASKGASRRIQVHPGASKGASRRIQAHPRAHPGASRRIQGCIQAHPGASGRIQGLFQAFPVLVTPYAASGIVAKCFGVLDREPPGAFKRIRAFSGISNLLTD